METLTPVRVTIQLPFFLWVVIAVAIVLGAISDAQYIYQRAMVWRDRRRFRRQERERFEQGLDE